MHSVLRKYWPLALGLILLITVLAMSYSRILKVNNGRMVYVLDDSYIHMAVAKQFSQHGVWGPTRHEFASISSSPLWTLVLSALYAITGPLEMTPLILNILTALMAVLLFHSFLIRDGSASAERFMFLAAFIFLVPLPSMVFAGLEHTLHILLTGAAAWMVSDMLIRKEESSGPAFAGLCLLSALLTAVRYESAFLIGPAALLLVIKRQWHRGLMLGICGIVPILVYGAVSVRHGWGWLPNSLLIKSHRPNFHSVEGAVASLGGTAISQLLENRHLLFLFLGAVIYVIATSRQTRFFQSRGQILGALLAGGILLHLQFARTGWFFRYEAYLVALALAWLSAIAGDGGTLWRTSPVLTRTLLVALLFIGGLPLFLRGRQALIRTPMASRNIHEQQIQMAGFLKTYYDGKSVAANDIGAINYFADLRCLDLYGLASRDVAELKREHRFTKDAIAALARERGVRVAILYDSAYVKFGGLPSSWIKVGSWTIRNNVICASATVTFYAVAPVEGEALTAHLREFSPRLPIRVIQSGPYTQRKKSEGRVKN